MNPQNRGTLYGIGVGPGDPELLTFKAVRVLKSVDVVFAAASSQKSRSLSLNVARPHIAESTPVKMLPFPMSRDQAVVEKAWKENAAEILKDLQQGLDAAFLTLGDAMTYSTYSYILKHVRLLAPDARVVTIPGITSFQASAARLNTPLVEGEESLLVLSGAEGGSRFREFADRIENIVFMKAYRNIDDIIAALEETGRIETSAAVRSCSQPEEQIIRDVRRLVGQQQDYWTLVLAKKRN